MFLQVTHEPRIGGALHTCGCVDADLLESSVVALFQSAINVGIVSRFCSSGLGEGDFAFASPHHSFGAGKNVLAAFDTMGSALNSWHKRKRRVWG